MHLSFGVYDATAISYATGQVFGIPFRIYYNPGQGGARTLTSIVLTDNSDQLGNTDIIFFNAYSDTLGLDSVALALVAADAHKVVGNVALTTAVDLGGARVLEKDNLNLVLPREGLWGLMVAKSTMIPTAVGNIWIKFGFK